MLNRTKHIFRLAILASIMLAQFGCAEDDVSALEAENASLQNRVDELDSMITRVGFGTRMLDANLDSITRLEEQLEQDLKDKKSDSVLLVRVQNISNLVTVNRDLIEELKSGMGDRQLSTKLLLDMILKLDERVHSKEIEIARLNGNLDNLSSELKSILGSYDELEDLYADQKKGLAEYENKLKSAEDKLADKNLELDNKENLLNRAYYFFGDKKELLQMGVIKKSSVFATEINENYDITRLNKVDIRSFNNLAIPKTKVNIVSEHPENSYELKSESGNSFLIILNSDLFWSKSKMLIIQTDK